MMSSLLRGCGHVMKGRVAGVVPFSDVLLRRGKSDFTERASEHFTFDHASHVAKTEKEEREDFEKFVDTYGDHRFNESSPDYVDRDFVVSTLEWPFVERLMPLTIVPKPPTTSTPLPSSFIMPKIKSGELPYHVHRTANHMLPVYCEYHPTKQMFTTKVSKVDGNLFMLRDELRDFLMKKYRMDFLSRVAEVYGQIAFRGDFEEDFKHFLLDKGF